MATSPYWRSNSSNLGTGWMNMPPGFEDLPMADPDAWMPLDYGDTVKEMPIKYSVPRQLSEIGGSVSGFTKDDAEAPEFQQFALAGPQRDETWDKAMAALGPAQPPAQPPVDNLEIAERQPPELSPHQRALVTMADLAAKKQEMEPPAPPPVTAKNLETIGTPSVPQGKPILPRVDIATASAVAADHARTGKPLEELYRERGYKISYQGGNDEDLYKNYLANMRMRALAQGDNNAARTLMNLHRGESAADVLGGNTMAEREIRQRAMQGEMMRRQKEMIEQDRQDRLAEAKAGREHDLSKITLSAKGQKEIAGMQAMANAALAMINNQTQLGVADRNAKSAEVIANLQASTQKAMQNDLIEQQKWANQGRLTPQQEVALQVLMKNAEVEGRPISLAELGAAGINIPGVAVAQQTAAPTGVMPANQALQDEVRSAALKVQDFAGAAKVLRQYGPILAGHPALQQQVIGTLKMNVPDWDEQVNLARGVAAKSGGVANYVEQSSLANPLMWAPKLGFSAVRGALRGLGYAPETNIRESRQLVTTLRNLGQLVPQ